jgi:sporulation protein YlmC with PRC-barrel domain
MTRAIIAAASGTLIAVSLCGPALAQGQQQTVGLMRVDPASLATGYRASKLIGSTVVNDAGASVGVISDLIITANQRVPFAVLSVGGFLGMDSKYVVIPFSSLRVKDKKIVFPGATKQSLNALPEFKYSTGS